MRDVGERFFFYYERNVKCGMWYVERVVWLSFYAMALIFGIEKTGNGENITKIYIFQVINLLITELIYEVLVKFE